VILNKAASRQIRCQIRQVLLTVWDPIGVQHEPNAQNEYDSYIGGVYGLLIAGTTDKQLTEHLLQIIHDRMGLNAATEKDHNFHGRSPTRDPLSAGWAVCLLPTAGVY
jgi:hypothetical protein